MPGNLSSYSAHFYDTSDLWVEARHFTQKWSNTTWVTVKAAGHEVSIFVPGLKELQQLQNSLNYQINKVMELETQRIRDELDAARDEVEEVEDE